MGKMWHHGENGCIYPVSPNILLDAPIIRDLGRLKGRGSEIWFCGFGFRMFSCGSGSQIRGLRSFVLSLLWALKPRSQSI